jgi:tRNA pseudouridine55 synthase
VEREPIKATVSQMEFVKKEGPNVTFRVTVSSGAYVRTLCQDIGEYLGVYGHLSELVRTANGAFTLDNCVPLSDFEERGQEAVDEHGLSLADGLIGFPKAIVVNHASDRLCNGLPVGVSEIVTYVEGPRTDCISVVDKNGRLLAIGEAEGAPVAGFPFMMIKPKRVML